MKRFLILLFIFCALISTISNNNFQINSLIAQEETQPQITNENSDLVTSDETDISSLENFWKLMEKAGNIRWAIFGVFLIGIFVIILKSIELILDRIKSKELANADFRGMTYPQLKALVDKQTENLFSRLFYMMINVFNTTKSAEGFLVEIGSYLQKQQESFKTFQARMAFLSDTAGALGLLGTIWGIFITFFSGNVDSQIMISGMGIALITTLIGLVVSMILNLCSTEIFSFFNKRIDLLASKAEDFRLRLMEIQQGNVDYSEMKKEPVDVFVAKEKKEKIIEEKLPHTTQIKEDILPTKEKFEEKKQVPFEIQIIEGNNQTGEVNTKLKKPLTVTVMSEEGDKICGVPVRFEIINDSGKLNSDFNIQELKTNNKGFALCTWTLGKKSGEHHVKVSTDELKEKIFNAGAIPSKPVSLKILSGNLQNEKSGQILPDELMIQLVDSFGNVIADHEITYAIINGGGTFPDFSEKDTKVKVKTDKNGIAAIKYKLGFSSGFNSLIVSAKELRDTVEFQELAQD